MSLGKVIGSKAFLQSQGKIKIMSVKKEYTIKTHSINYDI